MVTFISFYNLLGDENFAIGFYNLISKEKGMESYGWHQENKNLNNRGWYC